jgi:hypothetical protein
MWKSVLFRTFYNYENIFSKKYWFAPLKCKFVKRAKVFE